MKMWIGEIIISVLLIIFSVIAFTMTADFGGTVNPIDVGPAAFPRMTLILVIAISVNQIIISLRKRARLANAGEEVKEKATVKLDNKLRFFLFLALMVAYGFALPVIGFYSATMAFMFLFMLLLGERKWLRLLLVPTGFNLFIHVVFVMVLNIRLP